MLGIIPARAGSKRLPNKNLRKIGEKKLIEIAIENALNSKLLDLIIVNSDSDEIIDLSIKYNFEKIIFLKRPPEISGDNSLAIEYVRHSLKLLNDDEKVGAVCIIQPSSPLTIPDDIDGVIELFYKSSADSAVSIVKVAHDVNPLKLKVIKEDRLLPYLEEENSRMAFGEMPEVYVRNCSVYVTGINTIKKGKIIGEDCRGYIMPRERSVDINDEFDLAFAEFLFKRRNNEQVS